MNCKKTAFDYRNMWQKEMLTQVDWRTFIGAFGMKVKR